MNVAINEAACARGMISTVVTHDLRRGAAKDLKNLPTITASVRLEVGAALGHSTSAFYKGTTANYSERELIFLNSAKEQKAIADGDKLDPFGPKLLLEPYRKPILKPSQITEYI
jgi:hypothetical protein